MIFLSQNEMNNIIFKDKKREIVEDYCELLNKQKVNELTKAD